VIFLRDKTHEDFLEFWALRCRQDMKACLKEQAAFINSQINSANDFYKRLAKTNGGIAKIKKLKGIEGLQKR
jgi:hypothetical protein